MRSRSACASSARPTPTASSRTSSSSISTSPPRFDQLTEFARSHSALHATQHSRAVAMVCTLPRSPRRPTEARPGRPCTTTRTSTSTLSPAPRSASGELALARPRDSGFDSQSRHACLAVCSFAVGEAEADSAAPGVRILRTQDGGATWKVRKYRSGAIQHCSASNRLCSRNRLRRTACLPWT